MLHYFIMQYKIFDRLIYLLIIFNRTLFKYINWIWIIYLNRYFLKQISSKHSCKVNRSLFFLFVLCFLPHPASAQRLKVSREHVVLRIKSGPPARNAWAPAFALFPSSSSSFVSCKNSSLVKSWVSY